MYTNQPKAVLLNRVASCEARLSIIDEQINIVTDERDAQDEERLWDEFNQTKRDLESEYLVLNELIHDLWTLIADAK